MYIILNYIRKPLVSEMVTAAPHHLICSIDLGAALQQQKHHCIVAASGSRHARSPSFLGKGRRTLSGQNQNKQISPTSGVTDIPNHPD